ncbi:MAG TPA: sodium:alanine symporter family protein [Lachnospiraceae bacterium]|nr:sodium:alanine symporter family protein [Lachnospiraceae bacterium]
MAETISNINGVVNSFIWGPFMCMFFVFVGVYMSLRCGMFQITKINLWWNSTIMAVFRDKSVTSTDDTKAISQFQALTTALAATIGTGNIVGVSTAIVSGGPGAVFWMWVSAFFGMMTKYAEISLSMKYRYKNESGHWIGGPMVFIERGLKMRGMAMLFALFCLLASFGIGNMSQANSMAGALNSAFGTNNLTVGIVIAAISAMVIMGGIKRIGSVTEKIVPFMALAYIIGGTVLIIMNITSIPKAFADIFEGAFRMKAVGGGVFGYGIAQAMRFGVARGVFSNEAGLGSSSLAHSATDAEEPIKQAMWGVFEVFADTIVVCTITAIAILTANVLGTVGADGKMIKGAALTILAFSKGFGSFAGVFVSIGIVMFAFSTIIGWSYYGEKCMEYLFGLKYTPIYKVIYIIIIVVGCTSSLELVWGLSDTFNGLMAIPNLIAVAMLSGEVVKMTRAYLEKND